MAKSKGELLAVRRDISLVVGQGRRGPSPEKGWRPEDGVSQKGHVSLEMSSFCFWKSFPAGNFLVHGCQNRVLAVQLDCCVWRSVSV